MEVPLYSYIQSSALHFSSDSTSHKITDYIALNLPTKSKKILFQATKPSRAGYFPSVG